MPDESEPKHPTIHQIDPQREAAIVIAGVIIASVRGEIDKRPKAVDLSLAFDDLEQIVHSTTVAVLEQYTIKKAPQ